MADGKKFNFMHWQMVRMQKLSLAPHTSHLVKLSLANTFFIFPESIPMFQLLTVKKLPLMAHSYCMGPGQGQGPENDGFYIMLCIVHTTQGQGQGQRTLFSIVLILVPVPVPVPVPCSVYESFV